jgi:hypothetical protein
MKISLNITHTKFITGNKKATGEKIKWFCSNRDISGVMATLRNGLVTLHSQMLKKKKKLSK